MVEVSEVKMSQTEQTTTQACNNVKADSPAAVSADPVTMNMESVHRVVKLPVVEATINAATNLYEKAKEASSMVNYALSTAESTVKSGVERITPLAQPVTSRLEGPMKKVDELLCNGLDYVENKVPCVKLPPGEMYTNTKNYINDTVQPAVQSAKNIVEPAVQTARNVVDPVVQTAKNVVEPAMQTAHMVKDYGMEKVEELVKGKRNDVTPDGRPRRVRPALLPSSMVSLVYMCVSLEEAMQHQEHPDNDVSDAAHTCEKHSKKN